MMVPLHHRNSPGRRCHQTVWKAWLLAILNSYARRCHPRRCYHYSAIVT
jgi:hypothetical protein